MLGRIGKTRKVGIITDGRPEGQRNKITALGLEEYVEEIIITDELGGTEYRKPCDKAFRIMQEKMGVKFERTLYIGDNLKKDFQAPLQLGMRAVYFCNLDRLNAGEEQKEKGGKRNG